MRYVILLSLLLAACDMAGTSSKTAVDAANLPPLTAREQALIFGADGAAQQGNNAAAERDYRAAVGISTGHIEAHIALAKFYEKQHQQDKEREILKQALALQPGNPMANYMVGKLDIDDYKYNDALASFNRGLKQRPDDIDLNIGKAVTNDMLGNHTAAQMIYIRTMRANPHADLSSLRTNLAMSYLLNEEPKKAVDLLQAEAKKPNTSSVARHNLALAYGTLGRHADARSILHGEIDEETRTLAIARLREYWKARDNDIRTSPLRPSINSTETSDKLAVKAKPAKPVTLPTNSAMGKALRAEDAAKKAKPATMATPPSAGTE